MTYTIGIDTGGTFTDGVLRDDTGAVWTFKAPSTPAAPEDGVLACLDGLAGSQSLSVEDLLDSTTRFVHGTTIATNMMVALDGATVGLIATRGHRDALYMAQGRFGTIAGVEREALDHPGRVDKPQPLVPRRLAREVTERIDASGRVVVPLAEDEVRAAVAELLAEGVEAFAVCLLWSFRNDAHERRVGEIVEELAPGAFVTLSSDVAPRIGEYLRTSSTVINSYTGPKFVRYMDTLRGRLAEKRLAQPPLIMSSTGGCVTIDTVRSRPLMALQSGPAGGVAGAISRIPALGDDNVICTDMGGTSFDVGLVHGGAPAVRAEGVAGRYPYALSLIDIESIGSGGGSIASVSAQGGVHVGPQSAGAVPGPVCYRRGGERATVTDADLVLGLIGDDTFLGGRMTLDREGAERAIREQIAEPLGIDVLDAAWGVYTVVNAQMADLIRMKTIRTGNDPRDFTLLAFGGAGPIHAAMFARDLQVKRIVVPLGNASSMFSAFGLTTTDVKRVWQQSRPLSEPYAADAFRETFEQLHRAALEAFARDGFAAADVALADTVTMSFAGQIHALEIPVPAETLEHGDFDALRAAFAATYERVFGAATMVAAPTELMTFKVTATADAGKPPAPVQRPAAASSKAPSRPSRPVYWGAEAGLVDTPVRSFEQLLAAGRIDGPAILELPDTSVCVPPGDAIEPLDDGSVTIESGAGA